MASGFVNGASPNGSYPTRFCWSSFPGDPLLFLELPDTLISLLTNLVAASSARIAQIHAIVPFALGGEVKSSSLCVPRHLWPPAFDLCMALYRKQQ